jgi:GxxExxY protein
LNVKREVPIKLQYDGVIFEGAFRADLIVGDKVILELKSVEEMKEVHFKQLLTYLKSTDSRVVYC